MSLKRRPQPDEAEQNRVLVLGAKVADNLDDLERLGWRGLLLALGGLVLQSGSQNFVWEDEEFVYVADPSFLVITHRRSGCAARVWADGQVTAYVELSFGKRAES